MMTLLMREQTKFRYPRRERVDIDTERLAAKIREASPSVEFAYLLGSAAKGSVPAYSDLDVAVYLTPDTKVNVETLNNLMQAAEEAVDLRTEADIGILNQAGCVYRFQALQGRRLFVRAQYFEDFLRFYSLTCRMYEDYMAMMRGYYRRKKEMERRPATPTVM